MRAPQPIDERWLLAERLRYEQRQTYAEIGRHLGVSRERVRQYIRQTEHRRRYAAIYERIEAAKQQEDREFFGFSTRTRNAFKRAGLRTRKQIASLTDAQLLALQNIGPYALAETRRVLHGVMR